MVADDDFSAEWFNRTDVSMNAGCKNRHFDLCTEQRAIDSSLSYSLKGFDVLD